MLQQGHNKQFSKNRADIIRFFFFLNPYYFQIKKIYHNYENDLYQTSE